MLLSGTSTNVLDWLGCVSSRLGSICSNLKILNQNIEIHVHLIIIKPTNSLVLIKNDDWG